jgi:hypothetical protein
MAKHLTTTETMGRGEVDQPKVGPEGVRLAGASESKDTESTEDKWREIAARLALACIADGGDFREEVLRDYRNLLEEAGE